MLLKEKELLVEQERKRLLIINVVIISFESIEKIKTEQNDHNYSLNNHSSIYKLNSMKIQNSQNLAI